MHLLTLREPVNLGKTLGILPAGDWLMHDLNAFEIAQMAPRGAATVQKYEHVATNSDEPPLIVRSGAIGDLLLLTPALKAMADKIGRRVQVACFAHHRQIFNLNESILGIQDYPIRQHPINRPMQSVSSMKQYGSIISLENIMEVNHAEHATDVFAKALGLTTPLPSYKPIYHVTDEEKAATKKHLFENRPNLVIQPVASVKNRDYPLPLWMEVMRKAEQRGWGILIVGKKGQIPPMPSSWQNPFVRDLSQLDLSLRESVAVLSQAQAFCGVDSAFAHFCHALDIPAVVLFAAFDWKTRTAHAPKTIALSGIGECAPCNWHMHAGRMFPPNKPCTKPQFCTVLAGITPERVISKLDLLKP